MLSFLNKSKKKKLKVVDLPPFILKEKDGYKISFNP